MIVKSERENFWMLNWLDKYMVGHKGFICGGCFKNIFNGQRVKDIDMFFENQGDFDDAVQYFDSMTPGYKYDDKRDEDYVFAYENDNVKAYREMSSGIVIELIRKIFGTAEEILCQFDFTITKFAYYKEEVEDIFPFPETGQEKNPETHIEYKILMDDKFFEHLHLKRLVTDDKIPMPMSTFERTLRYAKYGYFPCRETKIKIAKAIHGLGDKEIEVSESLYDGMD